VILSAKYENYGKLQALESVWAEKLKFCGDPCILEHPDLGADIKKDWTLPPYAQGPFLEYVRARNAKR
jgi:hypothetical protein